ncbi:hypothetical protein ACLMJK_009496 [Lecanora helva]
MAREKSSTSSDVTLSCDFDVEEDVEAMLEEYVRLSHECEFEEANTLFDEQLEPHLDWYPVAAEHADCLLRQGHCRALSLSVSKDLSSYKYLPEERAVLELLRAIARCYETKDPLGLVNEVTATWSELATRPSTNFSAATEVAVTSLIQRLVFVVSTKKDMGSVIPTSSYAPLRKALFGVELDLKKHCLRKNVEKLLESHIRLPRLDQGHVDDLRHDIIEFAKSKNLSAEFDSFRARSSSEYWGDVIAMALHKAVEDNQTTKVLFELLQRTSVDALDLFQRTALHIATIHGHSMAAEHLIIDGADVTAFDCFGYTPMHYIAQLNDQNKALELSKIIFSKGKFIWDVFNNVSPLHIAIRMKHYRLISMFVTNGAQGFVSLDGIGRSPLQLAKDLEDGQAIRLLEKDDVPGKDPHQGSPLQLDLSLMEVDSPLTELILNHRRSETIRGSENKAHQVQWRQNKPTSILPFQLNEILSTRRQPNVLIIDTRDREDFSCARINGAYFLCASPPSHTLPSQISLSRHAYKGRQIYFNPRQFYHARSIIVCNTSAPLSKSQELDKIHQGYMVLESFDKIGWSGFFGFLEGGFGPFAQKFPEQVEWTRQNIEDEPSTSESKEKSVQAAFSILGLGIQNDK